MLARVKNPLRSPWFRRVLLPGFCFQSMIIAGGYGTGRELVDFFLTKGVLGGLLGMALVTVPLWSVVCALTFEISRRAGAFDYRNFARALLGRWHPLYEVLYLASLLVIVSVVAAAGGEIVSRSLGLPYVVGVLAIMAAVGWLVLQGTSAVESFLSFWSIALYAVYAVVLIAAFRTFGDDIAAGLAAGEVTRDWALGGAEYMAYNVGTLPAVLFCARHLKTRRDAVVAGLLAGPIGIIPAILFFVAISGLGPAMVDETVPSLTLLAAIGSPLLLILFQVVLFGTLVETATSLIHAFNERVARALEERGKALRPSLRPVTSTVVLLGAVLLAQAGLEGLIGIGYRILTYGFWVVFILPLLWWGVRRFRETAVTAAR